MDQKIVIGIDRIENNDIRLDREEREQLRFLSDMIVDIIGMGMPELIDTTEKVVRVFHREATANYHNK